MENITTHKLIQLWDDAKTAGKAYYKSPTLKRLEALEKASQAYNRASKAL